MKTTARPHVKLTQAPLLLETTTRHCRICGAAFEALDDDRQLCDEHLVECINGAGELEDDDDELFNTLRRTLIATARITCRVCERQAEQPIETAGLLCPLCREDLDATVRHIHEVLSAAHARFLAAYDRLSAAEAHADERTYARYENVREHLAAAAEGRVSAESVRRRYDEAKARGDSLSALLKERDAAEKVAEEYARLEQWAERGWAEISAAQEAQR